MPRVSRQTTLAAPIRIAGAGLHAGRRAGVTLSPAPADFGRRIAVPGGAPVEIVPERWVASRMSTSIALGEGRRLRTIEHLMAALVAHGVDNVEIAVDGPEVPILDGSARRWCRALRDVGLAGQDAPRRTLRLRRPVQVARHGGFLRAEPCERFEVDVTHDLLPAFPVMRWCGAVDAARFDAELAASRSFGNLHRRLGLEPPAATRPPGATPNMPDPVLVEPAGVWEEIAARALPGPAAPLLRGWRPWRAALVVGRHLVPPRRWPDEPVRHVALDMIGDLAVLGLPLCARVVAHNPSHEKTFALVLALVRSPECWEVT